MFLSNLTFSYLFKISWEYGSVCTPTRLLISVQKKFTIQQQQPAAVWHQETRFKIYFLPLLHPLKRNLLTLIKVKEKRVVMYAIIYIFNPAADK